MLAELRCWNDDLGIGDTIVGQEYNFQIAFGFSIVVDDYGDLIDKFDDIFGSDISWCCFSRGHDCSGYYFLSFFRGHYLYAHRPGPHPAGQI